MEGKRGIGRMVQIVYWRKSAAVSIGIALTFHTLTMGTVLRISESSTTIPCSKLTSENYNLLC